MLGVAMSLASANGLQYTDVNKDQDMGLVSCPLALTMVRSHLVGPSSAFTGRTCPYWPTGPRRRMTDVCSRTHPLPDHRHVSVARSGQQTPPQRHSCFRAQFGGGCYAAVASWYSDIKQPDYK